jgi:hypothetical protein
MSLRRVRGGLLRFIRRRSLAIVTGLALIVPAAWVEFSGRVMPWWAGGVALIAGATGAALLWTGIVGAAPDWIDDEDRS